MKYKFISEYHPEFGVNWLLNRLRLYPNDYYNYLKDRKAAYRQQKKLLKQQIKKVYHELNGAIGYRMICDLLNRKGIQCSMVPFIPTCVRWALKPSQGARSNLISKVINTGYLIIF